MGFSGKKLCQVLLWAPPVLKFALRQMWENKRVLVSIKLVWPCDKHEIYESVISPRRFFHKSQKAQIFLNSLLCSSWIYLENNRRAYEVKRFCVRDQKVDRNQGACRESKQTLAWLKEPILKEKHFILFDRTVILILSSLDRKIALCHLAVGFAFLLLAHFSEVHLGLV